MPFLSIAEFTNDFSRALTPAEVLVATRLLTVASNRITQLKPDADPTAAAQVVFEIVRNAVLYGNLEPLSEFENDTSRRKEAGTFDRAMKAVNDYLTDRHKRLLGIPLRAAPAGSFPVPVPDPLNPFFND